MGVETTRIADHDVLAVSGELDVISAPVLQDAVDQVMADGQELVLDLSGVRFLDSAGLRVLVSAHRMLKEHGGRLRIVCTTTRVREVLHIANLDTIFMMCDSVEEALAGE